MQIAMQAHSISMYNKMLQNSLHKLHFKVLKTVKSTTQLQILILCPLPSAQYLLGTSNILAKVTCYFHDILQS